MSTAVLVTLSYACCALVWGTTWFAIRVCIGEGGYPTLAGAAARFTVAAGLLLLAVRLWRISPGVHTRQQRIWLTISGVLNGLVYALVYLGEETVPGAFAAILYGTLPLLTAVFAAFTKIERITALHILAALVSLAGVAIIFWDRLSVSADQAVGVVLLFASVVISAIYSLILKRAGDGVHALCSTGWFLAITALSLWLAALAMGEASLPWPPPPGPTAALLYLAVFGSVLTYASYLYLLQRVTLMTTTTLVFIQPLIALLVDALWEPDVHLSLHSYLGAAVTLGGVLLTVGWTRKAVDS